MADDIVARADALLEGVTEGPWEAAEAFDASFVCAGDGRVSETWIVRLDNRPGRVKDRTDARFIAASRTLVPELAAELKVTRAELALTRDGYQVRPMTETESNLMTQVLDLRRERAESKAEVERLRGAIDRAEQLAEQWKQAAAEKGWRKHTFADELRAVLRGDQ